MRKRPKAFDMTPAEIEALIADREATAARLADGKEKQDILTEIASLRWYADAKRWIESPVLNAGK